LELLIRLKPISARIGYFKLFTKTLKLKNFKTRFEKMPWPYKLGNSNSINDQGITGGTGLDLEPFSIRKVQT